MEKKRRKIPTNSELREKYLRGDLLPTIFCPGCGVGTVLNVTLRAIDELGCPIEDYVFVSGIGCSSRIVGYIDADTVHTTHGRAIPFATGIKLTNPRLKVIVFSGDGDLVGIGGNHFIHAIRRNIDLTVIVLNNFIYGMTGGQLSPTTPGGAASTSFPYGNPENAMNIAGLATIAGAPYVARWTTNDPVRAKNSIKKATRKKGLGVVEVLSPCPTNYGRRNALPRATDFFKWFEERTFKLSTADSPAEGKSGPGEACEDPLSFTMNSTGKIPVGEFSDTERPEYCDQYWRASAAARKSYRERHPASPAARGGGA
ncbi:MAG: thiamine pyrophosphate-dependent enzyme [Promethearchaeota archaeon]